MPPDGAQQRLEALAAFDFTGHGEQSVREQWIYPLLQLLGYGVGEEEGVDIPYKVDLRPPLRMIGHKRVEVDYRPTVQRTALWIIEAKRASEDLFSDEHLGQAWMYATLPQVDVPIMMLANGERICVYELTRAEWDQPVLDIRQRDIVARFAELETTLGARRVADFVQRAQLRHLRRALRAQLDEDALDRALEETRRIVDEARPIVAQNRARVSLEAWEKARAERKATASEIGVWGMAFGANSAYVPMSGDIWDCVEVIRAMPADERAVALAELELAARVGETTRMTFGLHMFRLGVALRLVDDEACGDDARKIAHQAARDGAEEFPDDPVARLAHRFEMALIPFVARAVTAALTDGTILSAGKIKESLEPAEWLRRQHTDDLTAESMLGRRIELLVRILWVRQQPWTAEALEAKAAQLREFTDQLAVRHDLNPGQLGNPYFETYLQHDPLRPGTRNVIAELRPGPHQAEDVSDDVRAFAADLLKRYFNE